MKSLLLSVLVLTSTSAIAQNYKLQVDESSLEWKGEKIVGNSHVGTLEFKEGELEFKEGLLVGGKFIVDMATIEESNNQTRLERHLKSADFFEVEKYPTAELEILSSKKISGNKLDVRANLTIKEKTQEITFISTLSQTANELVASAELTFDRAKYDVRYGSNSFFDDLADKAISDDIELKVNLKATK